MPHTVGDEDFMSEANMIFYQLLMELLAEAEERAMRRKVSLFRVLSEEVAAVNKLRERREQGYDRSDEQFGPIYRVLWANFETKFWFFDTIVVSALRSGRVSDAQIVEDTEKLLKDHAHLFATLRVKSNGVMAVD